MNYFTPGYSLTHSVPPQVYYKDNNFNHGYQSPGTYQNNLLNSQCSFPTNIRPPPIGFNVSGGASSNVADPYNYDYMQEDIYKNTTSEPFFANRGSRRNCRPSFVNDAGYVTHSPTNLDYGPMSSINGGYGPKPSNGGGYMPAGYISGGYRPNNGGYIPSVSNYAGSTSIVSNSVHEPTGSIGGGYGPVISSSRSSAPTGSIGAGYGSIGFNSVNYESIGPNIEGYGQIATLGGGYGPIATVGNIYGPVVSNSEDNAPPFAKTNFGTNVSSRLEDLNKVVNARAPSIIPSAPPESLVLNDNDRAKDDEKKNFIHNNENYKEPEKIYNNVNINIEKSSDYQKGLDRLAALMNDDLDLSEDVLRKNREKYDLNKSTFKAK